MLFNSSLEILPGVQGPVSIGGIEKEPMVFSASPSFAFDNGGEITRTILGRMPLHRCPSHLHVVIDTRCHMLMKGMYPAIPGWHCDAFPRPAKGSQPDLSRGHEQQHFVCTVSTNKEGCSNTEFIIEDINVDVNEEFVWGSVHREVENLKPKTIMLADGKIGSFYTPQIHRASPCHETGWRFFIRASFYHSRPINKLRHQSQVYTTAGGGW